MEITALPAMAALGFLAYHLWRTLEGVAHIAQAPPEAIDLPSHHRSELLRRKRRLLEDLTEVDFDYTAGKVDASDREAMAREIKAKVVAIMKEIDVLDDVEARGARIEEELRRRLGVQGSVGG